MTAPTTLTRSDRNHNTAVTDTSTAQARATRFLEHVPPRLTEDLLFSYRVLRINRESGGEVVTALGQRLAAELKRGTVAITHRGDLVTLVAALKDHRAAAIELANHVASRPNGGGL